MKSPDGGRPSRIARRVTGFVSERGSWWRRAAARVTCLLIATAVLAILGAVSFGAGAGAGHPVDALATAYGPGAPIDFPLFPADNPWNTDISSYPVDPRSEGYIASIGLDTGLHPDFGTVWNGAPIGIPYVVVSGNQPKVPISFYHSDESDPGPYPIPPDVPIEGGPNSDSDRHILVLDADNKLLYEVYDAHPSGGGWEAGSGAVFDLTSNTLRPDGWTSADAAGLPILPGLVRYDEVQRGEIRHALRFTVSQTQRAYRSPATHFASDNTDPDLPPMGLRVRLKAGVDISRFPPEVQVVLRALKTYGMFVADNGADWYISGAPDARWDDSALHAIEGITGRDFEAVDTLTVPPSSTTTVAPTSTTTTTIPATPTFSDIGGSPYQEAILGLASAGVVVGYPGLAGPEFRPNVPVKRAQFAKVVCGAESRTPAALHLPSTGYEGSFSGFSDIHGPAMRVAEFSGLLDGLEGFGAGWDPWAASTRADVAQMLWNLMRR